MTTPYATYTEGDTYFDEQINASAWTDSVDADKTKALQMATNSIDRLNFRGKKATEAQVLQFPRMDDSDVPQDIKDACCEEALALLDGKDPELELENLRMTSQQYGNNIKSVYQSTPPEHIIAGIVSGKAWRFLKPYLRDAMCINTEMIS